MAAHQLTVHVMSLVVRVSQFHKQCHMGHSRIMTAV